MKITCVALSWLVLVGTCCPQQDPAEARSHGNPTDALNDELGELRSFARRITASQDDHQKALLWLSLNRAAKQFADQVNATFPDTTLQGDRVSPPNAQKLAQEATSYGVRIDYCEVSAKWSADNQGYLKYLELWPGGPDADESTWMGPMQNGAFCGDFEGSVEELQENIAQRKQFLKRFPNSRFAGQAKQELTDSEAQLVDALKSNQTQ
jgi:hypothetical protein